jgi:hypothetical protein
MGFWADFKKEIIDEMGNDWREITQEVEQEMEEKDKIYRAIDDLDRHMHIFERKFNKMVKDEKIDKKFRRKVEKDIENVKKMAINEIKDKKRGAPMFPGRREKMFNKYGGKTAAEAIFKTTVKLNMRYNHEQSNDAQWLNLNVDFFKFRFVNEKELIDLKGLEERAQSLKAERVMQKAKDLQEELLQEEKHLFGIVQSTNPDKYKSSFFRRSKETEADFADDYYNAKLLFEDKLALYGGRGRTDLLQNYNKHLEELKGQSDRVEKAILSVEKQLDPKKTLEEKTQSAQTLREEPQQENKDEQVQYVDALRKKLEKEKAARPAFDKTR